ncbi:hypothetical protein FOG18_08390 [Legionella israelensis]|uniref:hypothetical protein n=1 Tax=Legionella israelensis TaxID=454 RepID=UPI00117EAE9E|nr:hypothetical protein [Legionella israelensis]QDP72568.1 hypothetical protein FOG18_08390 [Legionella israelensis]
MSINQKILIQELQKKLKDRKISQPLLTENEQNQMVDYLSQVKKTFNLPSVLSFFGNEDEGAQHGRLFFHDSEIDLSRELTEQFGSNDFLLANIKEKIREIPEEYSMENYAFIWNEILLPYLKELEQNRRWQNFWQEEAVTLNVDEVRIAKKRVVSALTFKLFSELVRQSPEVWDYSARTTFVELANCINFKDTQVKMRSRLCAEVLSYVQSVEDKKNSSQLNHKSLLKKITKDPRSYALTEEEIYLVIIEGVAKACQNNNRHFKLLIKSIERAQKKFPSENFKEDIKAILGQLPFNEIPGKYKEKLKELYENQEEKEVSLSTLPQLSSVHSTFYYSNKKRELSEKNFEDVTFMPSS